MRSPLPLFVALIAACGGPAAETCVTGQSSACACADGAEGAQVCLDDGTYDVCVCGDDTTVDTPADTDAPVDTPAVDTPEVDLYAGAVADASSNWSELPYANGQTGVAAGDAACTAEVGEPARVCDMLDLEAAAAAGDLDLIPAGTTFWLQRTTPATLGDVTYAPGDGANCVNWTFVGNHLADGEYVTFDATGVPTWHLDADAFFDGISPNHITPGDLDCGGVTRAIPCCFGAR